MKDVFDPKFVKTIKCCRILVETYSPFPSIYTEDNYNLLVEQVKNSHINPVTDLTLGYEEGDYAAWDKYSKHLEELNEWKQKHLKKFTARLNDKAKKTNEAYEIIVLYYLRKKGKLYFYIMDKMIFYLFIRDNFYY